MREFAGTSPTTSSSASRPATSRWTHGDDAPTYLYRFSIVDQQTKQKYGGALHGADYPFVFGFGADAPGVADADQLAADMAECWADFAKGEDPECGGVEWPEVGDGDLLDFTNDGPQLLTDDPWRERLDLVESHRHRPYLE